MMKTLNVWFEEIPVRKVFTLNGVEYGITFIWNKRFDFICVILDRDDVVLTTNKLVYGNDLFPFQEGIPVLLPSTESDMAVDNFSDVRIKRDNFSKNVFIFFDEAN